MKLKSLLFMVTLLLCCLGVRAQGKVVFEEHFVAEPTDPSAVGFYEFINNEDGDERSIESNEGALFIFNADGTLDTDSWWRRAIKFRNLDFSEGKIYRLDFSLKGTNRYDDGTGKEGDARPRCKASAQLLQGEDDADISLFDYNGAEQRAEFQAFNESEYEKYSKTFFFASEALQKEKYAEKGKGELADKYFLSLSVFNPGMFYLKDVVLSETNAVQSAEFGQYAIKINFGSNTNIADLARADEKGLVLFDDLSFASVKAGDAIMEVEAIEYHADGCLYIFTVDEIDAETNVVVSFTNPTDEKQIKFKGSIDTPASLFDIENQEVAYNEALVGVLSYLYQDPSLKSSYPQDRAFAIDKTLNEFTFTFDRKISTASAKAVLTRGESEQELIVKEGQDEFVETITFVRNDNGLLSNYNKITLTNIISEQDMGESMVYTITFEAGKPQVAKETITPIQKIDFSNDNAGTIPLGWTLVNDIKASNPEGEVRASGTTQGSGPRLFHYDLGDYKNVFYVRSNVNVGTGEGQEAYGYTTATYGNLEGTEVIIPAGLLHIDFLASGYKKAGQKVLCEVLDATGENVLASLEKTTNEVTPDGGPAAQEKFTIEYNNPAEQKVIFRYTVFADGMTETMLSGIIVNTYEKTEGDTPDDKEIFADATYGGAENNCAPKAESGWELWQGGERRAAGGNFNYNGTRIFNDLALKGLKVGYYCNGQWPNGYVMYGTGELEGAPKLTLPAGALDITYYAANWKVNEAREIHFQILDSEGTSLVDNVTYTSPVNMDGQRGASYEADKFTFTFDCPAAGDYIIKLGSPAGETMIGNISIVQPGSRAVKFYFLLAAAVESAQAALVKCEDAMYDGATKTALAEAIAKYEDPEKITMTTEEEFQAAINELNTLEKSMLTRYEYIPRFNKAVVDATTTYTEAIGTKYEKLECYQALEETVSKYSEVNPSDLEDAELIAATTDLENYDAFFKNMKKATDDVLTKQIVGAANQLVDMDVEMIDNEWVNEAKEAISDDQEIAYQLKLRLAKTIYDLCAEGDPFKTPVLDPETGEEIPGQFESQSISAEYFVQNGIFYAVNLTESRDMQSADQVPGWTINRTSGNVGYEFSWVSWNGSKYNPIKDVFMIAGWNSDITFSQNVSELPVGKYRLVMGTQDRGFDDNSANKTAALETRPHWTVTGTDGTNQKEGEIFSYIYWQKGEGEKNMTPFDISQQGQWYGLTDCQTAEFDVTDDGEATGSVVIGANMIQYQSSASIDNARLVMVGKIDGYDYAAAAAKLAEIIGNQPIKGDVNGDGQVDGTDIQTIINVIVANGYDKNADVNNDGAVDGTDIQTVINIITGLE